MEEKFYYYEIGIKRGNQDLYIRGITSFIMDEKDDKIMVLSSQPPWIRVIVDRPAEVNQVVERWWNLFVNRFRKMVSGKTFVRPVMFREVHNDENTERVGIPSRASGAE